MKTLKKTLCLVLAVVMAVGVLVIPANAAKYDDFTDKGEITHETAVRVLNGMGVIDGKDTGAFDPKGSLTREEAAKLVVYIQLGKDSAEQLDGTTSKFSDVPTTNWACKYITYATQRGVINGDGTGKFNPKDPLTGHALAKMLLVAAGVQGKYTGDDWKNEVMLAANKAGFLEDLSINLANNINREDAAQMIWNAVNYSAAGSRTLYIVKDAEGTVLYRDTDATDAMIMKLLDPANNTLTTSTTNSGSLGDTVFGLTDGTATDAWGRTIKTYTNGKDGNAKVVYASFNPTPSKSYTAATKVDKILSDLGYKYNKGATLTIIEDGETKVDAEKVTRVEKGATGTAASTLGGRGSLIEVFKNSNDNYTVYVINTYVHKLAKDEITKYSSATANRDEIKANVTIEDVGTIYTDKFAKDDVVIYTVNKETGVIVNMAKADTTSGKVTASGSGYIRVDGAQMYVARNAMAEDLKTKAVVGTTAGYKYDNSTSYVFYKDFRDNVIAVKTGEEEKLDTDYIYVDRVETVATYGETSGDLITESTGDKIVAKARVIHLDTGAVEVVNLGMVKKDDGKFYFAKGNGSASKTPVGNVQADLKAYYEYVVLADGSYALVGAAENVKAVSLKKGQATLGSGLFANSTTATTVITFNPANSKTKTSKTNMTGYNSFPSAEKSFDAALYIANKNGIASELYIVTDAAIVESAVPVNYAIFGGMGETTDVLHYVFYVNGERVEYAGDPDDAMALKKGVVYDISVDDGELVKATPVSENKEITIVKDLEIVTVEKEYFIAKNGDANELYTFASSCLIVDAGEKYAKAELAAEDVVTVYVKDGKVELVVIDA